MIIRLLPVEGEAAFSPPHTRIGQVTPIGYTRQTDSSLLFGGGVVTLTIDGEHKTADLGALRKDVLAGRLKAADSATARALDVPFTASEKSAGLDAPTHIDTLAPPAFDVADPLSALSERKEK